MKPRILAVNEFTGLNTGYAVYMKELLSTLQSKGMDVAELALSVDDRHPAINFTPWYVFPNIPNPETQQQLYQRYQETQGHEFGSWCFNDILLQYKPTHVITIQDAWHWEYQTRSPLRKYYSHVVMPAVDAQPQHKQWLDMYASANAVLCYTEWGCKLMKSSDYRINVIGHSNPWACKEYIPLGNKKQLQASLGLGEIKIIGMVARNQPRKAFPSLFESFSNFLKESKRKDIYLYIHSSYPDRCYEFDEEINKYGIGHRVLFTYICSKCNNVEPSFFDGMSRICNRCGGSQIFPNVGLGLTSQQMCKVYNLMDLYCGWAHLEGFGIPIMEAGACGVHCVSVDYSAMSEVTTKVSGDLIPPNDFIQEAETGRMFAIPDKKKLTKYFHDYFSLPSQLITRKGIVARKNYLENWEQKKDLIHIGNWIKAIETTKPEREWNSKNIYTMQPSNSFNGFSNQDFVRFLICDVLGEPERMGSWFETRLIRDLVNGNSPGGYGGEYYNEVSAIKNAPPHSRFDRQIAYNHFVNLRHQKNHWEQRRYKECQ